MTDPTDIPESLFDKKNSLLQRAQIAYRYQLKHQPVYRTLAEHFVPGDQMPRSILEIPLMPIRAFKELRLIVDGKEPQRTFKSSGTGTMNRSRHHVADLDIYRTAIEKEFSRHFDFPNTTILCYAPGYSDNPDSSLLWMLNHLVNKDERGKSRFLPLNQPLTKKMIEEIQHPDRTILLFGAAFGLLDLLDAGSDPLPDTARIIETGGMKTYRRDMSKQDLRRRLSDGFGLPLSSIHSEYGMCELLSQMYAIGSEWFTPPDWMYVSVRDPRDPASELPPGEEGKIGIIDLANIYSCPFILTEDRGVMDTNSDVAVLGRWGAADLRGCNFLIERE